MIYRLINLIAFTILLLLNSKTIYAQANSPNSINCSGTRMNFESNSINFTVGDLIVLNQTDNQGNSIGSGFTTCATITTLLINEVNIPRLNVKLYPNPTNGLLNVSIEDNSIKYLLISIKDIQGKEIYKGRYAGISNVISINLSDFPSGSYLVSLNNEENNLFDSYKIILK